MKPFRVRDPAEQTRTFYRGYDPYFVRTKAQALVIATEKWGEFSALSKGHPIQGLDSERERQTLRAHVRFSEFHQFEACFALALAEFQELPHWLFLTTYQTADLLEAAEAFVRGDVSKVTKGQASDGGSFVRRGIYSAVQPGGPEHHERWEASVRHVEWMLKRAAERYCKAASRGGEYNAYKHGARVLVGPSAVYVSTTPTPPTPQDLLRASQDAITMLELEKKADSVEVFQLVRHFNPAESYCYIDFMSRLSDDMKKLRLARIEGTSFGLHFFSGADRDKVLALSNRFEFRVSS